MNLGYIKVYRSLQDKGYYKNSAFVHLWIHLLMCATYQSKEYVINGEIEYLQPGQFITSRRRLSIDTGLEESKVERILNVLKTEHQIEQQGKSKFRIISIVNWDKYQNGEQQNELQMNSKRTANEQQVNTINKDKKEKKANKAPLPLPDWIEPDLWKDFKDHRNKLRKPMTQKAEEILIKKIESLKDAGHNPKHLIITAIERGCQTVFEPK